MITLDCVSSCCDVERRYQLTLKCPTSHLSVLSLHLYLLDQDHTPRHRRPYVQSAIDAPLREVIYCRLVSYAKREYVALRLVGLITGSELVHATKAYPRRDWCTSIPSEDRPGWMRSTRFDLQIVSAVY
ncbi:hypothetical protein PISMIDRAFT_673032 [Pisolithus microcarpus 441]|uniref:Uncharacterized protein n=1 Tax=Pisolithus microcarpus 441 TaxID=765257 RepID=A0A0D0A2Z3_9AGAM|nr:hypothetical protein PISMIDRAFT_673032 [Pisolithus microcarpus 441]